MKEEKKREKGVAREREREKIVRKRENGVARERKRGRVRERECEREREIVR